MNKRLGRLVLLYFVATIILYVTSSMVFAEDKKIWKQVWSEKDVSIVDVICGKNIYVAVGDKGKIVYSKDRYEWLEKQSDTTENLKGIAFGNDTFVIVGSSGIVLTSVDGLTWNKATINSKINFNAVVYEKEMFVAIGNEGSIYTTKDAKEWTLRKERQMANLKTIAFNNGRFIVGGESSEVAYKAGIVYYSDDGIEWNMAVFPEYQNTAIDSIVSDGTNFYAVYPGSGKDGTIKKSQFGILWEIVYDKGNSISQISRIGSEMIVFSKESDKDLKSQDGKTWTAFTDKNIENFSKVFSNEKGLVALGNSQMMVSVDLKEMSKENKEIKVIINDEMINFDVKPQIISGRTLVPVRKIFEKLGANVSWDDKTKTAVATSGDTEVKLTIGSKEAIVSKEKRSLDVPAMIIDGRVMVPVRFISESFKCNVAWEDKTKTVIITSIK